MRTKRTWPRSQADRGTAPCPTSGCGGVAVAEPGPPPLAGAGAAPAPPRSAMVAQSSRVIRPVQQGTLWLRGSEHAGTVMPFFPTPL